jgi:sugar O-acyltransferase (sialic acid O-acetyltransferase NeuD family)
MYIFGASQHGKVVFECLNDIQKAKFVAFIDDNVKGELFFDQNVIPSINTALNHLELHIAIGNNKIRKQIFGRYSKATLFNIIHSKTVISKSAVIGNGVAILPSVTVNTEAKIGDCTILNTASIVEHDCIIDKYVHIAPGATLAGCVEVGEGTLVGARSVIIQGVKIGKWCTIGAGTTIIRDVPDYAKVVGTPGKIIGYNEQC